jgi:hypothetical protein
MPLPEKELKGILRSLKQINAALGTVANNDLAQDLQAVITNELATNVILDTAVAAEGVGNANLDLIVTAVGNPAGAQSIAEQIVALKVQVQTNHG